MSLITVISFLRGFLIHALIFTAAYVLFELLCFDLAGGETLDQIERQHIALFITALILSIFSCFYVRKNFALGRRARAFGILSAVVLALVLATLHVLEIRDRHIAYDNAVWTPAEYKPFEMTKSLVKSGRLKGLSREQVKQLLGPTKEDGNAERGSLRYLCQGGWTLFVVFINDKVAEVQLQRPFLGV